MKKFSILALLTVAMLGVGTVAAHAKIATNGHNLNGTALTGAASHGAVNGIVLRSALHRAR